MKRLFGLLNLLLCLELIIGPHFPGARIFSIDVAKAETCPSGLIFDSTLNRCITSDQNAALINATASCNGDKECYKRLAEEELKKGEEEGNIEEAVKNKSGLFNSGMKAAAVALPLIIGAQALMGSTKCLSTGKIAMVAGGLALFVGDMMANKKHKSCLKKIREDWEKKKAATTETTSSGISKVSMAGDQSEAFEMLAKSEECMQSSAKMKAGFYGAGAAAFGVTAVMSVMEIIGLRRREATMLSTAKAALAPDPTGSLKAAAVAAKADYTAYNAKVTCTAPPAETPAPGAVPPPAPQPPVRLAPRVDTGLRSAFYSPKPTKEYIATLHILNSAKDVASFVLYNERLNGNVTDNFSSPSIDEYENYVSEFKEANNDKNFLASLKLVARTVYNELIPIKSAEALMATPPPAGPSLVTKMLTRPEPRAVISGVLAAWAVTMMMHANKQARVAKNRAEFLRKLKDQFNDANGAISCTAEERSVSANANCYCYTEGGQRNQARANSQVCQQLFSGNTPALAGTFNSQDFSTQRVCIAANGAADEACACRQSRSCRSSLPGVGGSLGVGAISSVAGGLQPLNDLSTGNIAAGSINPSAAGNLAARLLDEKNKLAGQAKLDPKKQKDLSKQIEGSLIAAAAGQPSPIQDSSSLPMNMSASQAAQALEKELGAERSFERVSGSPALGQPGNSTPGDEAGFSLGTAEPISTTEETQLAEVMKQDLNYGQADITKSDSNIFQILTNRYQRSGMRRLFDENQKAAPEPANKNDISQ